MDDYRYIPPELTPELINTLCRSLALDLPSERKRVALVVRDHAMTSFKHQVPLRPLQVLRELQAHAKRMRQQSDYLPKCSPDVKFYLSIVEEGSSGWYSEQELLNLKMDSALLLLEAERRSSEASKGGRPKDPRIQSFIIKLLQTYKVYTTRSPTHSRSPDDGQATSKFGIFAGEAFRWFYPANGMVPWSAVYDAIRHSMPFDRADEMDDENQLKQLKRANLTTR